KRTAFDEKVTFKGWQTDGALECRYKFSVVVRINIRVRDFDLRGTQKITSNLRLVEVRVVKSDGHRPKKTVEIDQSSIIDCVVQIRAAAFIEIDDDLEPIEQDVLFDCFEDFRWRDCFFFFALCSAAPRRSRLREHGRNTHC